MTAKAPLEIFDWGDEISVDVVGRQKDDHMSMTHRFQFFTSGGTVHQPIDDLKHGGSIYAVRISGYVIGRVV